MSNKTNGESGLPYPAPGKSTESYWLTEPHRLANFRSSDRVPHECDIGVIGTGLSGVSTAYHILKKYKEGQRPRVVLFEARQACSGATGRNGGHCKAPLQSIKGFYDSYGPSAADEMVSWVDAQRERMKATAEEENLECDMLVTRSFDVFFDVEQANTIKSWLKEQRDRGAVWTKDRQWIEGPNLHKITGVKSAVAAASCPALSLWPYKFVTELLSRVIQMGAELYTETIVKSVEETTKGGVSSLITTTRGTTRARKVVFATNAYSAALSPGYRGVIIPTKGQASHLVPNPDCHHGLNLGTTYNLFYTPNYVDYMNPRPNGTIVLGGGSAAFRDNLSDRNDSWYNTVDDTTLINDKVTQHFDETMETHFRGWEKSGAHVHMTWTGIMGNTPDRRPHVGKVPGTRSHWILAGFNGGGMAQIFTTSDGVAEMVTNGVEFEATRIPRLFKTTQDRMS